MTSLARLPALVADAVARAGAILALALAMAPSLPSPVFAQGDPLDAMLEKVRVEHALPALAAAVSRGGEIVASGIAGVRAQGTLIEAEVGDRFHLGSDTKAMTATLAGMMVEEGKLRWDSTIGEVLGPVVPGMNEKLAAVTLEQLLSHSSGIPTDTDEIGKLYFSPDAFEYEMRAQRLRLIDAWKANAPKVPEGSPFQYANLGYIIAGAMIERAANAPWEELITRRIFEPLGLKTAGLGPQARMGRIDAPVGHKLDDNGAITPMFWGPAADVPPVLGPAGIAHMSILDFVRWAAWNAGGGKRGPALVGPETLARIHRAHVRTPEIANPRPGTPKTGEYALGWGIVTFAWSGGPVLTHAGSNGMNLAQILIDPAKDLAIVVTTNITGEKADAASLAVLEMLYRRYGGGPAQR